MIKPILDFLLAESGILFEYKNDKSLRVGGRNKSSQGFAHWLSAFTAKELKNLPAEFLDLQKLLINDKKSYSETCSQIFKELIFSVMPEAEPQEQIDIGIQGVTRQYIMELYPVQDIQERDRQVFHLYHQPTGKLSEVSFQHWRSVVDDKIFNTRIRDAIPGVFEYDPMDPSPMAPIILDNQNGEGYPATRFNTYRKPKWLSIEPTRSPDKGKVILPQIAQKFFTYMFPDIEVRRFVYCWVHHMLTHRAKTYLYLPAKQGTGKTTFAYLCSALVGFENFETAKSNFADTTFNSFINNKRLVLLDEFAASKPEHKDTLKRVINDKIQIEAKGIDQKTVTNFCSFIICNNAAEALAVDPIDRRFSIPEMTATPMLEIFTLEELEDLNSIIRDETSQVIADIGHWFLEKWKNPIYRPDEAWQKRRFEEVVFASSRDGMKFIIDKVMSKKQEKYEYGSLQQEFKRDEGKNINFPLKYRVREYIDGFRFEGDRVATTYMEGVKLFIKPEPRFQSEPRTEKDYSPERQGGFQ